MQRLMSFRPRNSSRTRGCYFSLDGWLHGCWSRVVDGGYWVSIGVPASLAWPMYGLMMQTK